MARPHGHRHDDAGAHSGEAGAWAGGAGVSVPALWRDLSCFTPARVALGRAGNGQLTDAHLAFQAAHPAACDAVHAALDILALLADLPRDGLSATTVRRHVPSLLGRLAGGLERMGSIVIAELVAALQDASESGRCRHRIAARHGCGPLEVWVSR